MKRAPVRPSPWVQGIEPMHTATELSVTLSADLLQHLRSESQRLDVPLEWLVASIVADTLEVSEAEAAVVESPACWEPAVAC